MRRFIVTYQREGYSPLEIEGVEFSALIDKPVALELYPDDEWNSPRVFRNRADMEFHLNEFGDTSIKWLDASESVTVELEHEGKMYKGVLYSVEEVMP